jgi:serine/threonine-protein kinase SRPK3
MSDSNSSSENNAYHGYNGDQFYGEVLKNRYMLIDKLGYGAFSSVWVCYDLNHKRLKACKIQNSGDYQEGLEEKHFLRSIRKNNFDYINNMIEDFIHIWNEKKYVVMVYEVMIGSLYDSFKAHKKKIPLKIILKILKQFLLGLNEIHKCGIIHTDIKPENTLLQGKSYRVIEIQKYFDNLNLKERFHKMKLRYCKKKNWDLKKEKVKRKFKDRSLKNKILVWTNQEITRELKDLDLVYRGIFLHDEENLDSDDAKSVGSIDSDETVIHSNKSFDPKYLEYDNIKIAISDFGTIIDKDYAEVGEIIQTRYYRAPEILLGCKFTQKIDIWSVGCMLYEFVTDRILFRPFKDDTGDTDQHHVNQILNTIGEIPTKMIDNCINRKNYFNISKNKKNKYEYKLRTDEKRTIQDLLLKYRKDDYDSPEMKIIISLLVTMLTINPKNRPTANTLLKAMNQLNI